MRTRGDENRFMDITWSTKKNVNYDSRAKDIRKNSEDKEDITTTQTQVPRTSDTLWSNNGQLQKYGTKDHIMHQKTKLKSSVN